MVGRVGPEPLWTVWRREKYLAFTGFGTPVCSSRGLVTAAHDVLKLSSLFSNDGIKIKNRGRKSKC
jgi:hypothetical protein